MHEYIVLSYSGASIADILSVPEEGTGGQDDDNSNEEVLDPEVFQIAEDFFSVEEREERQAKAKKKFVPAQNRVKWHEDEEVEIKELFKKCFENKKKPTAKAIRSMMKRSKEREGLVHKRTESALKNKVYRMLNIK